MKNENHNFGKVARLSLHKCLQSDMGKVWEQKKLMFDVIPIAKKRMILDILRNQLELDNC